MIVETKDAGIKFAKARTVRTVIGEQVGPNSWRIPEGLLNEFKSQGMNVERVIESVSFDLRLPKRGGKGIAGASTSKPRDMWSREKWNISKFREEGLTGKSVKVGIIDSGLDFGHPSFKTLATEARIGGFAKFDKKGNITHELIGRSQDVLNLPEDVQYSHYHGTHCAGIICANQVGGKGEGISPSVELFVANALDRDNGGEVEQIYVALEWLAQQRCDIVSISLGWWGFRDHWAIPIRNILQTGAIVVAASGNEYSDYHIDRSYAPTRSPGNYAFNNLSGSYPGYFLSIGATDKADDVAPFSGGGKIIWPDTYDEDPQGERVTFFAGSKEFVVPSFVAPGVDISAPVLRSKYDSIDGTSQSTPHVAGLLALVLEKLRRERPEWATPRRAAEIVVRSLTDHGLPGVDERFGSGLLDINALF